MGYGGAKNAYRDMELYKNFWMPYRSAKFIKNFSGDQVFMRKNSPSKLRPRCRF